MWPARSPHSSPGHQGGQSSNQDIQVETRRHVVTWTVRIRCKQLRKAINRRFDVVRIDEQPTDAAARRTGSRPATLFARPRRPDTANPGSGRRNNWSVRWHAPILSRIAARQQPDERGPFGTRLAGAITPRMTQASRPWLKGLVDYGPLAAFLLAYWKGDLFLATAVLMVAAAVVVALAYAVERRIPLMPVITAGIVLVFGGLTLALDDERFIKMKPTIVQWLFAAVMVGGLFFNRPVLKPLFGSAWRLTDQGWRILTARFAIFFFVTGALNEVVWRTQSTDVWVSFKVFGLIGLTVMFVMTQIPLVQRHHIPDEDAAGKTGRSADQ